MVRITAHLPSRFFDFDPPSFLAFSADPLTLAASPVEVRDIWAASGIWHMTYDICPTIPSRHRPQRLVRTHREAMLRIALSCSAQCIMRIWDPLSLSLSRVLGSPMHTGCTRGSTPGVPFRQSSNQTIEIKLIGRPQVAHIVHWLIINSGKLKEGATARSRGPRRRRGVGGSLDRADVRLGA